MHELIQLIVPHRIASINYEPMMINHKVDLILGIRSSQYSYFYYDFFFVAHTIIYEFELWCAIHSWKSAAIKR